MRLRTRNQQAHHADKHHANPIADAGAELNLVENIWQYMRANWLSGRVVERYDAIIEAICEAWNKLIEIPDTIKSNSMSESAHVGRPNSFRYKTSYLRKNLMFWLLCFIKILYSK